MASSKEPIGPLPVIRGLGHLSQRQLRALLRITFGNCIPGKIEIVRWAIEHGFYEADPEEIARRVMRALPKAPSQPTLRPN